MKICARCGKGSTTGIDSSHKHSGAWAMRAPDSKKVWQVNLQPLRVRTEKGWMRVQLCIKCLRIVKATQNYSKQPKFEKAEVKVESTEPKVAAKKAAVPTPATA